MREVHLNGVSPVPLSAYLKGLGAFRLLAEQADPGIRACWADEHLVLWTELQAEDVLRFFLEEYRPTPMLSPWNGGGGFYRPKNEKAWQMLGRMRNSNAARFGSMVRTIRRVDDIVESMGLGARPENDQQKRELLLRLRAQLDDEALSWLDAAVLLTQEASRYPPLLGSGGNDGRLDFTSNYLQRLEQLFDLSAGKPEPDSALQLESALFDLATPALVGAAVGQFAPGTAGGPNSTSTGDSGASLVNPWDYVLMLEGALLFAASATRRFEAAPAGMSFPFTTHATGAGAGGSSSTDEGTARAEMWLPLWNRPASLAELRAILSEGRASVLRSGARDGLDFVRAIARLGVDRGLSDFQRYAFLQRSGRAFLATPLNRVPVRRNPDADLIDQLDRGGWLNRVRRAGKGRNGPGQLQMLVRRLENDLFELAQKRGHGVVQAALISLGAVQEYLARSPAMREAVPPPPRLGTNWVMAADDGSHEFRIAAALSGLDGGVPMRLHFAPLHPEKPWTWKTDSRLHVWRHGALEENLYRILIARTIRAEREGKINDKPFFALCPADEAAVAAFFYGRTDDRRIGQLLRGLTLASLPDRLPHRADPGSDLLPAAYALLKPFFSTDRLLQRIGVIAEDKRLSLPAAIPRLLRAGRISEACEHAQRGRRAAGMKTGEWNLECGRRGGLRLLATLIIPVSMHVMRGLERRIAPAGNDTPETVVHTRA